MIEIVNLFVLVVGYIVILIGVISLFIWIWDFTLFYRRYIRNFLLTPYNAWKIRSGKYDECIEKIIDRDLTKLKNEPFRHYLNRLVHERHQYLQEVRTIED